MKFTKHKPQRAFQHIVEQIQKAILEGSFQPGESLPSEMKLKEMFGASRGTVREALRILESKGLVQIKTGAQGGAVVTRVGMDKMAEVMSLWAQSQDASYDHLAEFRVEMEGLVAELAAQRASEDDIAELRATLDEATDLLKKKAGWDQLSLLDIRIHVGVAKASGNPVLRAVLHMIHETILGTYDRYDLKGQEVMRETFASLQELVDAIERRDGNAARKIAEQHVLSSQSHMKNTGGEE